MLTRGAQCRKQVHRIRCGDIRLDRLERIKRLIGHAAQMSARTGLDGDSCAGRSLRLRSHDERDEIDVRLGRLTLLLGGDLHCALDSREPKDPARPAVMVIRNEVPATLPRDDTPGIDSSASRGSRVSASVVEGDDSALPQRCHERQQRCVRGGYLHSNEAVIGCLRRLALDCLDLAQGCQG